MVDASKAIAKMVEQARVEMRLAREELAVEVGVDYLDILDIEEAREINSECLDKVLDFLEIDLDNYFGKD